MDDQKVRALVKAVYRTHLHTVGVFAFDAIFANNERHTDTSIIPRRRILAVKCFENWSVIVVKFLFQLVDSV